VRSLGDGAVGAGGPYAAAVLDAIELAAPITAVVVYPSTARVTRRGTLTVPAGASDVVVRGLPASLRDDSVRVAGQGAARIVGVDVPWRFHAEAPDARVHAVEARLRGLRDERRALEDRDAVAIARAAFLDALGRRGGRSLADALATGDGGADRVADFEATLAAQLSAVAGERREVAGAREASDREIAAAETELESLRQQARTSRREVVVSVEADAETRVEVEASYLVDGALWQPAYDARLDGELVTLTWHGLVTQSSGEDWPAVELALSTARPATTAGIPELDPWYVDEFVPPVARPPMPMRRAALASDELAMQAVAAPAAAMAPMPEASAIAEQGVTAVTWRLPRPVAVPSDGSPHKATITTVSLDAALDHLCAPKLAEEAYLRATVTNGSPHTLLPGRVSVFHGPDFVGTSAIEAIAPGEEFELQLGVDDRVTVERKLTKRETSKNLLGNVRRTAVTYTITVENHLPVAARVAVLDQFPVSRHERIKVEDKEAAPEPAERTDLGVVTWKLDLAPGAKQELTLSFQLEHPRDLRVSGFSD
jgi:uncharacterized protein (TIGR02231 family)